MKEQFGKGGMQHTISVWCGNNAGKFVNDPVFIRRHLIVKECPQRLNVKLGQAAQGLNRRKSRETGAEVLIENDIKQLFMVKGVNVRRVVQGL